MSRTPSTPPARPISPPRAPTRCDARDDLHRLRLRRQRHTPYAEDRPRDPINAYGRTKAAGEELALERHPGGTYVVRTAWLYGAHGPNFAKTMLALAESRDTWSVVDDQLGQPTWTADLAAQIVAMLDADAPAGIYHGTNSGSASWFSSPAPCSTGRVSTPSGSPRPTAAPSCARRRARRTPFSATTRGGQPDSRRCATGGRRSPTPRRAACCGACRERLIAAPPAPFGRAAHIIRE